MKPEIAAHLIKLNRHFYTEFAAPFSATRQRLQPGVTALLEKIPVQANLLDLGCGNGKLARALDARGHQGFYVGLDLSSVLLEDARHNLSPGLEAEFHQANLAEPGWEQVLSHRIFDVTLCLAVLHHLPGTECRRQLLGDIYRILAPGGLLMLSVWQFLQNERLRARIQPWEYAGLQVEDVDPGDYLLDWRRGGHGLRYVHHFDQAELQELADGSGFAIQTSFKSDGQGGQLSLYQIWNKPAKPPVNF
jgi:tRNA (uracil-5-)-methyltransferase TRM9